MANLSFPWLCGMCGRSEVRPRTTDYRAKIKHDGRLYDVEVPGLEIPTCDHCGEQAFDIETDEKINVALRKTIGLLQPAEIRAQRKALGLKLKELADKLGTAVASLSRWENGASIQSRSTDRLLRIFFRHPNDPVWHGSGDMAVRSFDAANRIVTEADTESLLQMPFAEMNPLEETLLGRLLLQPDELLAVSELVHSMDFTNSMCRHVYEAMLTCLRDHATTRADHFVRCVRDNLAGVEPEGIRFLPFFVEHVRPSDRAVDIASMLRNRSMIHDRLMKG